MVSPQQTLWRESASLILASKLEYNSRKTDEYSYEILLLKRSDRTAFITNQTVFPGGIFEKADQDIEWLEYFEEFGVTKQSLRDLVIINDERPSILMAQGTGCYDRFFNKSHIWAREISLRITAIREAFEEVGILLCRDQQQINIGLDNHCAFVYENFNKEYWQKVVHNDPYQFLILCRELRVIPDLWGLYEWSAWASPAAVKKRYETVFFIAFLEIVPKLLPEASEVKECMLLSPANLMQRYCIGEVWLMPPQFYEISRLIIVKNFDCLLSFAKKRTFKGVLLYLPVGYICIDGIVSVLPGDDFYPDDPRSATFFKKINLTIEDFRLCAKKLHRFENIGSGFMKILLNFEPLNDHLPISICYRHKL